MKSKKNEINNAGSTGNKSSQGGCATFLLEVIISIVTVAAFAFFFLNGWIA